MDFHENPDSENDTEVIESLFSPYTDEPFASLCIRLYIYIYAATNLPSSDCAVQRMADREDGLTPLANW